MPSDPASSWSAAALSGTWAVRSTAPRVSPGLPCWAWTCASSRRPTGKSERAGESPLFSFGRLVADQIDEQGRQVGARHRQPLGRLSRQQGAVVLMIEHKLKQATFDGAGFGLERQVAVALDPIGDIQPDIA